MKRNAIVAATLALFALPSAAWAESPVWVTKLIHRVPRTETEVAEAHAQCKNSAVRIPAGSPLVIGGFADRIAYDVTLSGDKGPAARSLLYGASRLGTLSFGLDMNKSDQSNLPLLSSSIIMNHINGTYVSVQVRVHRQLPDGPPYLHYRPLAAMADYGKPNRSTSFEALVEESIDNVRGLGLFAKEGAPLDAESLRTLVIANKCRVAKTDASTGEVGIIPYYDLFFVRARVDGEKVTLHSFATKDELTKLCYIHPYEPPEDSTECGVTSTIYFTNYTYAGQYPTAQAARACRYNSRAEFTLAELDRFAASRGWRGDALDNLTELLDAIIDGQVRPRGR